MEQLKIKCNTLVLIGLSAIFIYSTSTFLRLQYNFYFAVFLYIAFIFVTGALGYRWRALTSPMTVWFFLFLCVVAYLYFLVTYSEWATYLSGAIHIYFWTMTFAFLADNFSKEELKKYNCINLAILLMCVFATIRATEIYPLAARAMYGHADGISNTVFLHKMGCGGFGFVYGFVFLTIGIVVTLLGRDIKKGTRIFLTIYLISIIYMIIKAGFSIALGLTLAIIVFCLTCLRKTKRLHAVWLVVGVAALVLFRYKIFDLIRRIAALCGVSIIENKMSDILYAIASNNLMDMERFQVYSVSVKGFLNNPIFGSGYAGGDSQILSLLSYVGIFGLIYVGLVHSSCQLMRRYIDRRFINVLELSVIVLAVINPFNDMTLMSMVFLATPCVLYVASSNKSVPESVI